MTFVAFQTNQKTASPTMLQKVAKADKIAVKNCIDTYGGLIWALAKKFTATGAEAEEAVCEIFLDIWRYAERFDPAKLDEVGFVILLSRRHLIKRLKNQPLPIKRNDFRRNSDAMSFPLNRFRPTTQCREQ